MTDTIVNALKEYDRELFDKLHREITPANLHRYLKKIADTYAPSQSVTWTRAAVLEKLLAEDGYLNKDNFGIQRNFKNTGNTVIFLGSDNVNKQVWLLAHLDQITYIIEKDLGDRYLLMPICYHLLENREQDAVTLAYDFEKKTYMIADRGKVISTEENTAFYIPGSDKKLHPGMRVCFDSQLTWDQQSGKITGSLDDAAGAVALVMAARFLSAYNVELMLGLTDEEEGKAGVGNQTICRGGARLLRYFNQPDLVIASDIHEAAEMYGGGGPDDFKIGDGASFAEKAAKGSGTVIPPHIYALMRQMSKELASEGIRLRENHGGYVSRTESVNAMFRTPNISLIGFLGENRHFQRDVESANINDLVDLAKTVVCFVLYTQTTDWKELIHTNDD